MTFTQQWRTLLPFILLVPIVISYPSELFTEAGMAIEIERSKVPTLGALFIIALVTMDHSFMATTWWIFVFLWSLTVACLTSACVDLLTITKSNVDSSNWLAGWFTFGLFVFDWFSAAVSWGLAPLGVHLGVWLMNHVLYSPVIILEEPMQDLSRSAWLTVFLALATIALIASKKSSRRHVCWALAIFGPLLALIALVSSHPDVTLALHKGLRGQGVLEEAKWKVIVSWFEAWRMGLFTAGLAATILAFIAE